MTVRLFPAFSTNDVGLFNGTLTATSGSTVLYWQAGGEFVVPFGVQGFAPESQLQYSGAVDKIADDLSALSSINFSVYYDNALNRCVLSSSQAPYELTFNSVSQRILGFQPSYTSTKIITGSVAPWFVWSSAMPGRAKDTFFYEPSSEARVHTADSGRQYAIGRRSVEMRRDWEFVLEPRSKIYTWASSSTEPYTWQRFIQNLREGPTPFVLFDNVTGSQVTYEDREALYQMTPDGMYFNPKPVAEDQHSYWTVKVSARAFFVKHRGFPTHG